MDEFEGEYEMFFSYYPNPIKVELKFAMRDSRGDVLYLLGIDGTIYNWANIVMMKRVEK